MAVGSSIITLSYARLGVTVIDEVRLTVYPKSLDLDIDSDNNNDFGQPAGTAWEETLEVHPYGLGKLIMLDNATRQVTPVVVKLPPNFNPDNPNLRVRIDWDANGLAGWIKLWNTRVADSQRNLADAAAGGHSIGPELVYSLRDLNYDPASGEIVIYAEGTHERAQIKTLAGVEQWGKPDERIKATLMFNGDDIASDEVKYIVANENSYFYHLQTRQEVRNALASRGVYGRDDMPEFSLQLLDEDALAQLGMADNIADLLGPAGVPVIGHAVAGFNAVLYLDYITGEDQFVLSFGGTDITPWSALWDDWVNNVAQGFGLHTPQYEAAMRIGNVLANIQGIPTGHLIATGHSLGGGLASAASVVGGFPAHTYNAAGLHPDTLLQRDINGDLITNGAGQYIEHYAGSYARYDSPSIDAYFVDYDILSIVQDTLIPEAIGTRWELVLQR